MNRHLQSILNFIQHDEGLTAEEKGAIAKSLREADKELEITALKLERTEKVKRTTAILLEETIEELEQKKKAVEAQNQELEIESSLERVRAQAMGMKTPGELPGICEILFAELRLLGFPELRNTMINIHNDDKGSFLNYDFSEYAGRTITDIFYNSLPAIANSVNQIRNANDAFAEFAITGKELDDWRDFRRKNGEQDDPRLENISALYYYFYSIGTGAIGISTFSSINEEKLKVLKRFRNVFDFAYQRYVDVTQAEAQAKEAKIEAALERVRARTMAMQRSEELAETVSLIFKQLLGLGIRPTQMRTCAIVTLKADKPLGECWITSPDGEIIPHAFTVPYDETSAYRAIYAAWKQGEKFLVVHLSGAALLDHLNYLKKYAGIPTREFQVSPDQPAETYTHALFFSQGYLLIVSNEPLPGYHDIFKRFGAVFQQTYTRFLDLQKAEAQGREARIEASLERVRSRTMAMQRSDELSETAYILFQQLKELGEDPGQITIGIINEAERVIDFRITRQGSQDDNLYKFTIDEPALTGKLYAAWQEKEKFILVHLTGKELSDYIHFRNKSGGFPVNKEDLAGEKFVYAAFFSKGLISISTTNPRPQETIKLLERFAGVFEGTYTRFLDLKHAEAQAREAQIEASLERVRSKAMSMQKSEDLAVAVATVFEELDKLNLGMLRCGIGILDKVKCSADIWTTTKTGHGTAVQVSGDEPMNIHPLLQGAFDAWLQQEEDYSYLLQGEDLVGFYKALNVTNFKLPDSQSIMSGEGLRQYYYVTTFNSGGLYAFRETSFPGEAKTVMKRFADVFNFTYTRFSDLKQAEAQAREAKIETALERVRSRTLAMQKSDELAETAAVVFRQLINLGIEPNRLYIGIINDNSGNIEFWVTDEDGTRVRTQFTGNTNRSAVMAKMYAGWEEQKKSITIDIQGKELADYFHYLGEDLNVPFKYGLSQKRRVQSIAYFSRGLIGIASPDEQPEETTFLLERFAGGFNLTFTRFNDLKIAEAHAIQAELDLAKLQIEKRRAEDALTELRATQTQLIHSEKMASLGELTAGIAHEIQNPLNFVNNFSEVNTELIDELQEEVDKGNLDEVKAISNSIKENEQKINHHGKRADAIVKGMLQHSRSSNAVKEPTDINALADEYIRLCYHGVRAKDKSFNTSIKTDFDETIGKVNIIPQDIGRVILNLLTNAFYEINEKKKQRPEGYEPIVSVTTKKFDNKIEIKISDNGNGIPQKVVDKIFQPFFTTKPTGQGTGLGLSLGYDIITKAHAGELKVETKEGEGSAFIIQLPL